MKSSFSLFEVILSLLISSIVVIYSMFYAKELFFENKNAQDIENSKLKLLSTKLFLQKHKSQISKLKFEDENLYFDEALLLEDIKNFGLEKNNEFIYITINYDDKIKQKWSF